MSRSFRTSGVPAWSKAPWRTAVATASLLMAFLVPRTSAACDSGFFGPSCLACPSYNGAVCGAAGTCSDGASGDGACTCDADHNGSACQYSRLTTCNSHGFPSFTGSCFCDAGFAGSFCTTCAADYYPDDGACTFCSAATTCNGNGTCSDTGSCVCNSGFTGSACDTAVTPPPPPPPPTPPTCALTGIVNGPPKQIQITVQSASAGLASVQVTESTNATVSVPAFSSGDEAALVVVATKIDQSQGADVALSITDVNGLVTNCDPILPAEPGSDGAGLDGEAAGGCSIGAAGDVANVEVLLGVLVGLAFARKQRARA